MQPLEPRHLRGGTNHRWRRHQHVQSRSAAHSIHGRL